MGRTSAKDLQDSQFDVKSMGEIAIMDLVRASSRGDRPDRLIQRPLAPRARPSVWADGASRESQTADFRFAVAPLALLLIGYPAVSAVARGLADAIYVGVTILLIPLILYRLDRVRAPAALLASLILIYALSSAFSESNTEGFSEQGFRNTITLAFIGCAFLTFSAYGQVLFSFNWFPSAALTVVMIDLVAVYAGGYPKNKTAAAILYVCAFALVYIIRQSQSRGWVPAIAFTALCGSLAIWFDARFMVFCAFIFIAMFIAAAGLSGRIYRIFGLVVAVAVVPLVIWFFLNVDRGGLAREFGQRIAEISGRRAESGRDVLFPYLLHATQESQLLGLGAGTLPRDIISTGFSAHNYYIQLYLQVGVLGLAVLIIFLLVVWNMLSKPKSAAVRFGSALFVMFVVHNATEVIMFQNAALMAVPAWSAIGLAYAIAQEEREPGVLPA